MHTPIETERGRRGRRRVAAALAIAAACAGGIVASADETVPPTLEDARLLMGKWIETQQIIAKERNDWEQGRQVLDGRLKLVKDEIAALEEKIEKAKASVGEANGARDAMQKESDAIAATASQLATSVTAMEAGVLRLVRSLPEPVQQRLAPLRDRIPTDASTTKVTIAERFQNVLGILNEVNKANTEITVNYEVRTLSDGRPAEVRALYIGLAQAYFVSASGEAGIGRPTADGWKWESSNAIAGDVLVALEIIQGKHTPAFVPLPVKIQ